MSSIVGVDDLGILKLVQACPEHVNTVDELGRSLLTYACLYVRACLALRLCPKV